MHKFQVSRSKFRRFNRKSLSSQIPKVPNFINGKFEESKSTVWTDVKDPCTQKVLCKVPQSTPEELKRAEVNNYISY